MATVRELLEPAVARLRASGSETARLDAELLLGRALGIDRTGLIAHPDALVGDGQATAFEDDLRRRERGEPVAYIRGFKEFAGIALAVDRRVLIPRPETELLVDLVEAEVADRLVAVPRGPDSRPLRVADVGTGSGAIATALAVALRRRRMLDEVEIVATDASDDALEVARLNAVGHGVADRIRFASGDLLGPLAGDPVDVLAANLPYIPSGEVDRLPIAASFEPREALDGGPDGLAAIRRLLDGLSGALLPDGVAFLEIGFDQAEALAEAVDERLPDRASRIELDLSGRPRVARIERVRDD
ncbi:MAG TPA: peptide chain release factor N(5)-glutamine methyltransferase [Candidatus Limnocylindrales bacterium]|nr:peptide chain release factor N(5)-glutamine methyltransferase [Candidatus Limnocylindrales bacterium]